MRDNNGRFVKGYKPIWSLESRKKASLSRKGKKLSYDTKNKISKLKIGNKIWLGRHHKPETIKKLTGIKRSKETREKISLAKRGEKNWTWKGGISFNPYPKEFNKELKFKIRFRDNFTCCLCGRTERDELEELNRVLCVNHIDFNKNNCNENNLNTLCLRCNVKINRDREYYLNYFKSLYV